MIDKNTIRFNGPSEIYHVVTYLWSSYGYLLGDNPEPIRDFMNRVVKSHPSEEVTCRHISKYLDD